MRFFDIFGKKEKEKRSRKPYEDFLEHVASSLSKKDLPIIISREKSYCPLGYSLKANSEDDKHKFSAKVRLEVSSFTDNDHFFAYDILFNGDTNLEIKLQEKVIGNDKKYEKRWSTEDSCHGVYTFYSRLENLETQNIGKPNPDRIAKDIYDIIKGYTDIRKKMMNLIEKLYALRIEKRKIETEAKEILEKSK